jgi:hypothetical protein
VEQILLPDADEDVAVLDVEEDSDQPYGIKFEDQDWDQFLPFVLHAPRLSLFQQSHHNSYPYLVG